MTGSYLLHGARIGKVILHLFEDRLEVRHPSGEELKVDPADLAVDLKDEHRRLLREGLSPNFIETLLEKLGISLQGPDSPMEKLSTRELPDPSHELARAENEGLSTQDEDLNAKLTDLIQSTETDVKASTESPKE